MTTRPRPARAVAEIRRRAQDPTRRQRTCDPLFHEMGRLHYATVQALAGNLDPERTVYGELRAILTGASSPTDQPPLVPCAAASVDSAISNASYASRVYAALVVPGRLTDDEFDKLTFADCLASVRVGNLPPVTARRHKLRLAHRPATTCPVRRRLGRPRA
ncbi:MAG: hypothetical protein QOE70_393 [Chthoniobacter sp.]|jgi:hypothetical protein|nr:hypothetical protein [Chthoniobacter sp.]